MTITSDNPDLGEVREEFRGGVRRRPLVIGFNPRDVDVDGGPPCAFGLCPLEQVSFSTKIDKDPVYRGRTLAL